MQKNINHYFTSVHLPVAETLGHGINFNTSSTLDEDELLKLIQQNTLNDTTFNFSFINELKHFLHFAGTMFWAFPIGLFMRRLIRKNKRLNHILQFRELLSVRNNIEKGSFAYDTLLFKISPFQLLKNKSHLANLVCLAILFGDEFIDGLATQYGKENIQNILVNPLLNYYLKYKIVNKKYELYYQFNICDVIPKSILEKNNPKYNISYQSFYNHLNFLLKEMNRYLKKLQKNEANEVAMLICKVCNNCFDTYKVDINAFNEDYTFHDLLQYQKTKDDDIIQVLLTLRAVLLNKKSWQYQKQFSTWSSMISSMQLYDDMQDAAADCNYQMNRLCYLAKKYFYHEWQWLLANKQNLLTMKGLVLYETISFHMPASTIITMQFARNISTTKLNWVQRKIQNYLWCKNWLGFNNELLNNDDSFLLHPENNQRSSINSKLHFVQLQLKKINHPLISNDMKWSHFIDLILMDKNLKEWLFKIITKKEKYFLTSCFLEFPISKKAALAKRIVQLCNN